MTHLRCCAALAAVLGLFACTSGRAAPAVVPVGASVERAALLSQHGLTQEAKRDLIDVISGTDAKGKPEAYYQLGTLAFREGSVSVALETWRTLSEKFPGSPQATLVKDRLGQLAEVAQEVSRSGADNAVAQSYLSHADFWSERRGEKYRIDTSWLPVVEMAVAWYDRVIKEFPKTTASRLAHERKVRTLLGWAEPGSYGSAYGAHGNMATYMPQVEAAFAAFEVEAPDASATLQALRFQIAQRYWSSKKWPEARSWLNAMVQKAGEQESFYKDLAQRRLAKLEF